MDMARLVVEEKDLNPAGAKAREDGGLLTRRARDRITRRLLGVNNDPIMLFKCKARN